MLLRIGIIALLASLQTSLAQNVTLIDPLTRYGNITTTLPPFAFPVLHTDFTSPPDCGETSYNATGTGRLRGLRTLITGGDSGIGRAVVIAYLREGAQVAINYLPEEEADAQALAEFLEPEGLLFERIPGDLQNETFCTYLVNEAARRLGGLDILIGNAGYSGPQWGRRWLPIANQSTTQLERTFRTNVFANLFLTRAAVPLLPRGGSIIFTTSAAAHSPHERMVDYGASKDIRRFFQRWGGQMRRLRLRWKILRRLLGGWSSLQNWPPYMLVWRIRRGRLRVGMFILRLVDPLFLEEI